jgi:putative Mn2+ efflux pump MntP
MPRWRYALIAGYVAFGLVGSWLAIFRHSAFGVLLFGVGLLMISVHIALEWKERRADQRAQEAWISEVNKVADDVSLDSYGIGTLEELARYHDLNGRAAVMAALRNFEPGQRSLLAAARRVEPDAVWD